MELTHCVAMSKCKDNGGVDNAPQLVWWYTQRALQWVWNTLQNVLEAYAPAGVLELASGEVLWAHQLNWRVWNPICPEHSTSICWTPRNNDCKLAVVSAYFIFISSSCHHHFIIISSQLFRKWSWWRWASLTWSSITICSTSPCAWRWKIPISATNCWRSQGTADGASSMALRKYNYNII